MDGGGGGVSEDQRTPPVVRRGSSGAELARAAATASATAMGAAGENAAARGGGGGGGGPGADRSGKPAVIMVVDDNEIDRMVAESFVGDLGYDVVSAASGIECLQVLHDGLRKQPDSVEPPVNLILLDVLMPQMDGYETLKKLRQEKRLRTIPVIMVTGIDDRANVASFLRAGVDDYVLKPLVLQELQVRLTVCLERRRLQNWVDALQETDDTVQANGQLRNTWAFWFDSPGRGTDAEWEDSMQPLGSFQTIKEFWKVWGALDVKLPEFSHFRLFKQGIKPTSMDPANVNGGKIIIRAKKSDTSRIWFELILITITQQLVPMEAVNGIVLSIRPNENMVSVWVRSELDKDHPFISRMSDTLRGQLGLKPSAKVFHQYHQDERQGGSAGSGGRAGSSHTKARSLPQTPDYGSDEEGGPMGGLGMGVGAGVGFQPDELTQKLMQLATERSGKDVSEVVTIEPTRSGGGGADGKRGAQKAAKGALPQTMEGDESFESESDHDGPISGGGGDPMAFGRLCGRGGELRLGSANSTPRSIGGSEGGQSASSARSSSPSSPLAMEGGTAGSAFSTGTFSSGGGTPKAMGLAGVRAMSSPNLSGLVLKSTGAAGSGGGRAEPPSPMALSSPRSSSGRPAFGQSAEIERAAKLHAAPQADATSESAVLRARAQRRGRSASGGNGAAPEGVAPNFTGATDGQTRMVPAPVGTAAAVPGTGAAVAPGGTAQGLNVTVAFVFCVTLVWLTGLIVYFS